MSKRWASELSMPASKIVGRRFLSPRLVKLIKLHGNEKVIPSGEHAKRYRRNRDNAYEALNLVLFTHERKKRRGNEVTLGLTTTLILFFLSLRQSPF